MTSLRAFTFASSSSGSARAGSSDEDRAELADACHRVLERPFTGPVRDEHELRLVADALLPHALERDPVPAEHAGDLRQHAGTVLDAGEDVVLALHLGHRADRALVDAGAAHASSAGL